MASAQMQMSSNAPLPSLHTQNQSMVVQRQPVESPPKRGYYDVQGSLLIQMTYIGKKVSHFLSFVYSVPHIHWWSSGGIKNVLQNFRAPLFVFNERTE